MIAKAKSPLIIAHRGSSAVAPENTLAAFARAIAEGADGIELDVRLSRDRVPVVIHDATLTRTGLRRRFVSHLTAKQLVESDVGIAFHKQHRTDRRPEYTRETVPSLDDVFNLIEQEAHRKFIVYVEMKGGSSRKRNEALVQATVETIHLHQAQDRAVVISFDLKMVARVKQLDDGIRTGALFGSRQSNSPRAIIAAALKSGAEEIALNHQIVTEGVLALARENNLTPVVWTVDDPRFLDQIDRSAIACLMTNHPAKFISAQ